MQMVLAKLFSIHYVVKFMFRRSVFGMNQFLSLFVEALVVH